jgi:hypothetical protein
MCSHLKTPRRFLSRAINLHPRTEGEKCMPLSPRKRKPPNVFMCSHLKTLRRFLSRAINLHPRTEGEKCMPLSLRKRKPPRQNHLPKKPLKDKSSRY